MVKLRVTVRILSEEASITVSNALSVPLVPGEKRFHVVVREPESCTISDLAQQVGARYKNFYKHDLGDIKYIRDNTDDADLILDDLVVDTLVDEGKTLHDPSDQHVAIKVIIGTLKAEDQPDISPIQSQVRPLKKVESVLGKRKIDEASQSSEDDRREGLQNDDEVASDTTTTSGSSGSVRSTKAEILNAGDTVIMQVPDASNSLKTILPYGMTQQQYDSIVKNNAHLNTNDRAPSTISRTSSTKRPLKASVPEINPPVVNPPSIKSSQRSPPPSNRSSVKPSQPSLPALPPSLPLAATKASKLSPLPAKSSQASTPPVKSSQASLPPKKLLKANAPAKVSQSTSPPNKPHVNVYDARNLEQLQAMLKKLEEQKVKGSAPVNRATKEKKLYSSDEDNSESESDSDSELPTAPVLTKRYVPDRTIRDVDSDEISESEDEDEG